MDKSYLITQCGVLKNLMVTHQVNLDYSAGNPNISYYESLFSPSVNVTLKLQMLVVLLVVKKYMVDNR